MGVGKNLNLFWAAGTGLAVYFLFVHAPQYLATIDISPTLWIHIFGVYPIYLACIHNTLITPTTFSWARGFHVWVGRIGLVLGVMGFITGVILEWSNLDPDELGGAIGVTVGGTIQMTAQFFGYRAIKRHQRFKKELAEIIARHGLDGDDSDIDKKNIDDLREKRDAALISHVYNMLGVFLLGCGIPSMNRLPFKQHGWIYYLLIVVFVVVMMVWGKVIERRIRANSDRQQKVDGEIEPCQQREASATTEIVVGLQQSDRGSLYSSSNKASLTHSPPKIAEA